MCAGMSRNLGGSLALDSNALPNASNQMGESLFQDRTPIRPFSDSMSSRIVSPLIRVPLSTVDRL